MVKNRTALCGAVALLLLAIVSSCGDQSSSTSPSGAPTAVGLLTALNTGEVISLKTSPPSVLSPTDDAETDGLTPLLTIRNSQPRFIGSADFTYLFEVYKVLDNGAMVPVDAHSATQTTNTTSYRVGRELTQARTTYGVPERS